MSKWFTFLFITLVCTLVQARNNAQNAIELRANQYWQSVKNNSGELTKIRSILTSAAKSSLTTDELFKLQLGRFLDDQEFPCRLPTIYRFFTDKFGAPANISCTPLKQIKVSDGLTNRFFLEELTVERVRQIHLMFVTPGDDLASAWGHIMLRLEICPKEQGHCLADIAHHIAIGFAALIDENKINYWRGLTGGYKSSIGISSLTNVIKYYTEIEDRNMISLPLNITHKEKKFLVDRLLERYWSHDGNYTLTGKNCATETFSVLRSAIDRPGMNRHPVSPQQLFDVLNDLKLIDEALIKNVGEATQKGYYFPARGKNITAAFAKINSLSRFYADQGLFGEVPEQLDNIDSYFESTLEQRKKHYWEFKRLGPATISNLALSFYQLEQHIEFLNDVKRNLDKIEIEETLVKKGNSNFIGFRNDLLEFFMAMSYPPTVKNRGYGIPPASYLTEEISNEKLLHLLDRLHSNQALLNSFIDTKVEETRRTNAGYFLKEAFNR